MIYLAGTELSALRVFISKTYNNLTSITKVIFPKSRTY